MPQVKLKDFSLKEKMRKKISTSGSDLKIVSKADIINSLPGDILRTFIDKTAEAQRAMGFENEKDHPEVAPSQFELNYSYSEVVNAADQIQIYKLVARQVASNMKMTATFLPKPIVGINGSGCIRIFPSQKKGKKYILRQKGRGSLSPLGWEFVNKILSNASESAIPQIAASRLIVVLIRTLKHRTK